MDVGQVVSYHIYFLYDPHEEIEDRLAIGDMLDRHIDSY